MKSRCRIVQFAGIRRLALVLLVAVALSAAAAVASPVRAAALASPVRAAALASPVRAAALADPARTAAPSSGLQADGPTLLLDGHPVTLRGVAMGDPVLARRQEWDPRPLSDYAVVHDVWHANVVRLSIHPSLWKHADRAGTLAALDEDVGAALAQGMCVIVDWHTIGWPDGAYEVPPASWGDPSDLYDSDFALATSFWSAVAPRYADEPRVAYELWNEPMAQSDLGWPVQPLWSELRPYWVSLLATIRASAGNLVIATGNQWSHDLEGIRQAPLSDDNVAYAWHVYSGADENDARRWAAKLDQVQTIAPVIVTEWGFEPSSGAQFPGTARSFGHPWVKHFLDGRGLHSTAWCWHPDWTPALLKDWYTPSAYGRFVRQYLWHRPPRVTCEPAAGEQGGVARVRFVVRDAGAQVRLWLRVDDGRARALGWRTHGRALAARVSCALSRGRHTYSVTAENLIARSATGSAVLIVN
jgi:hypothetical protein